MPAGCSPDGTGPDTRVHAVVISWEGQRRGAAAIAAALAPALGPRDRLSVIYSNRSGARETGPGDWEQVPQSWFFGAKFAHSLKLAAGAEIMLQVQADAVSTDWPGVLARLVAARAACPDIGVWAPDLSGTPYCQQVAVLGPKIAPGLYPVAQTDGVVWAIDRAVLARLAALDYGTNHLGWGIDYAAIAVARSLDLRVVRDTGIRVGHPRARGYSDEAAEAQGDMFAAQLTQAERQDVKWLQRLIGRRRVHHPDGPGQSGVGPCRWDFIPRAEHRAMDDTFRNLVQDIFVRRGRVHVHGVADLPDRDLRFALNDTDLSLNRQERGPLLDDAPMILGLVAAEQDTHELQINALGDWQIDGLDTARLTVFERDANLSVALGPAVTLPAGTGDLEFCAALAAHRTWASLRLQLDAPDGDDPANPPLELSIAVGPGHPGGDRIDGWMRVNLQIPGADTARRAQLFVDYAGVPIEGDPQPPIVFVAFPHITRLTSQPDLVWPHRIWGHWQDDTAWFTLDGLDGPLAASDRLELIHGDTRQPLVPPAPAIEVAIASGAIQARCADGLSPVGLWVDDVVLETLMVGPAPRQVDGGDALALAGDTGRITLRDASGSRVLWACTGADLRADIPSAKEQAVAAAFDAAFYTAGFPADAVPVDPLAHYRDTGWREGRDPAAWFSTRHYLARHTDVADAGIDPFEHYILQGRSEQRALVGRGQEAAPLYKAHAAAVAPGPDYEDVDPTIGDGRTPLAQVIAYYLPQFHRTDVNDANWGTGFTEWRNLPRALPRFEGHVQPRIPRDLGFYDLDQGDILRRQIEMARAAGLHGFCFYHYWFDGRRVLDSPMERLLADPSLDFPFCLMWANENWTRTWDGHEQDVLLRQSYRPEDDAAFVDDLARHFADPRYMRVDGRPILFLYRPGHIPDAAAAITRWRALLSQRHGMTPLIYMAQGFGDTDPRPYGLDGAIEFPPHKLCHDLPDITAGLPMIDPGYEGHVMDYDAVVARAAAEPVPPFPLIRTITPHWDNEARRPGRGMVLHGSTPDTFGAWLSRSIAFARDHPAHGERIVCINAWNEWAEGAVLEPCVHYGGAYLNAVARAVFDRPHRSTGGRTRVLIVGHDAHVNGAQLLALNIGRALTRQMGVEVHYILGGDGPLLERYRALGRTEVIPFANARLADRLWELKAEGVSLALANTTVSGTAVPALKSAGFQVVALVHELRRVLEGFDLVPAARALAAEADRVIFPARVVRDAFESVVGPVARTAEIFPQGLYHDDLAARVAAMDDPRAALQLPADARVVVNVGFADMRKGIDRFVAVAKMLCATRRDLHFAWVGPATPDALDWHMGDVARAGLAHRIRITGFTDDVASWYAAADLFFLTAREDPFPSVVLEALAVGLPVVGFEGTGGCDDLIARHGALVAPGDLQAARDAIVDLLGRSEDAARAAARARRDEVAGQYRFDSYCHGLLQRLDDAFAPVSVVLPNYNYERHLPARLRSIFHQGHPVLEVLALDDASSDASVQVIRDTAAASGRDVVVVENATNSGGPFPQWRRGARMARGDYVWIAEADDLAAPELLERVVARMRAADSAIGFCDSWQMDDGDTRLGDSYIPYLNDIEPGAFDHGFDMAGPEFLARFLSVKNVILNVSSVVFRRDALLAAMDGLGDDLDGYRVAGDWRLYAEICAAGGAVSFVAEPLNGHRRHPASVTHALEIDTHLGEIAAMQDFAAARTALPDGTRARQAAHLAACRAHLEGRDT